VDHEGRRGGARAFGRQPTTRAAAWRCLARHALKRTTAVLQPCTVRRSDVLERAPLGRAAAGTGHRHRGPALTSGVRLSPACTRGPLDCRVTVTTIISQAPTALPLAGARASTCQTLRRRSHLGSCQGQGSKKTYSCARHTTHTKPQYRGAGARSRQIRRPAGSRPARPSVPSRLAARRSPTWAGVTPPFAALAASLPTGPRAPLEPDPRLQTSPATIAVAATILTAMAPAPRDLATHFSPFIGRDQGYQASHGRQHI
jgi:hypothetical protein